MTNEEYTKITENHIDHVYRLALCYTKSEHDANDVVQNVFFKLYSKPPVFKDSQHERYWLTRVTVNECKNYRNSYWNKNTQGISDIEADEILISDEENPENQYIENDRRLRIFNAVMSLKPKYRMCIHLYYYEDYNTKEIARILSECESTVRMRLMRGRKILKEILKEEWISE